MSGIERSKTMAYNFFPYYPNYPQPQMQTPQPQNAGGNNSSIIWVQGEAGAKSYLVAPNNTVQLWDSESQTIYLKSADASGMPSMRILDYTIRSGAPDGSQKVFSAAPDNYLTLDDLKPLQRQIDAIKSELGMNGKAGLNDE